MERLDLKMQAMISSKAKIGKNVVIAPNAVVYDNVEIGDNVTIGPFCIIGEPARGDFADKPLVISDDSIIRSHSILYEGSQYGPGLRVGHSSMLREGIVAGESFQVGSFNDLEGDIEVGRYVRFHSNVHIGRGAKIGNFVWVFPYVVFTNDPLPPSGLKVGVKVEDGCIICTSAVLLPGTVVREGAMIGAMTRGRGEIPSAAVILGFEGKIVGSLRRLHHKETGKAHPWMSHFAGYYPEKVQPDLSQLHSRLLEACTSLEAKLAKVAST